MEDRTKVVDFGDGVFELYLKVCGFYVGAHIYKNYVDSDVWFEIQAAMTFKSLEDREVKYYSTDKVGERFKNYIMDYMSTNH